jgi:hypothetical protein
MFIVNTTENLTRSSEVFASGDSALEGYMLDIITQPNDEH